MKADKEEQQLRSVALQNARAIHLAREKADRDLVLANQRITSILESITDAFCALDKEWRFVFVNRRAEEIVRPLHSAAKESLLGITHWDAFPESRGTIIEEQYRRAIAEQVTVHFEAFYSPLNAWFDIRAYPSPDGLSIYFQDITQGKREAEELRQQKEWFAVTLGSIGDSVITTDVEGRVTFLNAIAEQMTGWTSSEAIGEPLEKVFHLVHEQTREVAPNPISKVLRDGEIVALANHTALVAKDGKETAIEDSAAPIRDTMGTIVGAVMVFHDVGERRRAEDALRESEERLRGIFNQAAVGIAIASLDGLFVEVNQKFTEILGYPIAQLREKTVVDLTHPDDLERTRENMRRLIQREVPHYVIEKRFIRRNGSEVWCLTTVTLVKDAADKPLRFIGVIEDISARKKAEESALATARQLQLALAAGHLGDWSWDAKSDLVTFGTRGSEIFGLPNRAKITWARLRDLLHEDDREPARVAFEQALANHTDYEMEYRVGSLAGGFRWVAAKGRAAYGEDDTVLGVIGVVQDITEQKRTEGALRESEQFNRSIIESSRDCIKVLDLEGNLLSMEKNGQRLLGIEDITPFLNQPWTDFWHGEDRDAARVAVQAAARGEVGNFVGLHQALSGHVKWWDVLITPIRDSGGRPERLLAVSREVTERKQSEERLRQREGELRALADSIPQLAWIAEPDGNIFWYNRKWYEYTGTELKDMQGWGWQSVHDPEILPSVMQRWTASIQTGHPFEMEFPLRGSDGVFRWFLTRVNPVRDGDGKVVRWFGTNTDVDTVRKAQEALRDETRILELLNDTGSAIAAKLDVEGVVQIVTDAATKLCGAHFGAFFYNVVDARGESLVLYTLSGAPREAFEKFGHPRATPLFGPTFRGEGVIRSDDILKDPRYGQMPPHHGMPAGHLPVRSYLAVSVVSRSGEVMGGLFFGHPEPGVFTERTERLISGVAAQAAVAIDNARLYEAAQKEIAARKQAEEALRASERELATANTALDQKVQERTASLQQAMTQMEEFSYSVSHDLRAPLRAIEAYSGFLNEDFAASLPPDAQNFLAKISRNVVQMNRLINDVLTLSKMSRNEMQLYPVALQPLIDEIIEQNPQMQPPQADIQVNTPDRVVGDDVSLSQAIANLLGNAVKFVAPGVKPVVKLWTEPRGDLIRFWIQDNGIGIKPEYQTKLFGMFQRLTGDANYEGTGIGLAIVRKAVERMGGKVGVESNGSSGSRFWIDLKKA